MVGGQGFGGKRTGNRAAHKTVRLYGTGIIRKILWCREICSGKSWERKQRNRSIDRSSHQSKKRTDKSKRGDSMPVLLSI